MREFAERTDRPAGATAAQPGPPRVEATLTRSLALCPFNQSLSVWCEALGSALLTTTQQNQGSDPC